MANAVAIAVLVGSILSFAGGSVIIYFYAFRMRARQEGQSRGGREQHKSVSTMYWRLLFWVALSDVGYAVAGLLMFVVQRCGSCCMFQAFAFQVFAQASALWVAALTHFMGRVIVGRWALVSWVGDCRSDAGDGTGVVAIAQTLSAQEASRLERCYHVLIWSVCAIFVTVPLSDGLGARGYPVAYGLERTMEGRAVGWCWVTRQVRPAARPARRTRIALPVPLHTRPNPLPRPTGTSACMCSSRTASSGR